MHTLRNIKYHEGAKIVFVMNHLQTKFDVQLIQGVLYNMAEKINTVQYLLVYVVLAAEKGVIYLDLNTFNLQYF
ncbi:hypothetical protein V1478_014614 [Vespula squamosa]|uniref:Uncharacterized protein n=1 Tax=Vespula squamosa TaxID=30214 RepID=A0ABD2A2Q7_VESSQ